MVRHPPTLSTERLILRPFSLDDAPRVQDLAGERKIYATTLNVPHPYEDGMAEVWIASLSLKFYTDEGVFLAVTLKDDDRLVGSVSLTAIAEHKRADLGYWIGVPYWGNGYCTEAAIAIIRYGFDKLGYHKITARHVNTNPASGKVMIKAGMRKEGELVDEMLKDGEFQTLSVYGVLRADFRR